MLHRPDLALALSALAAAAICLAARAEEPPPPALPAEQAPTQTAPSPAEPRPAAAAPADAVKRVVYVPETVKAELRRQIEEDVLARAQAERWAVPNAVPEWLKRIRLSGDVRARYERDLFQNGNGIQPDFNAINTNKPFDVNPIDFANDRFLDVDQDRTRPRLRARLGLDADVTHGFSVGLRLASGENASPVSTNQTLSTSGGNFSKYQLWLDRASIRWAPAGDALTLDVGRFENPFLRTDLVWSENVNFDGIALRASAPLGAGLTPFLAGGAFPLYTTAINFPAETADKLGSSDRWLYAAQLGTGWKLADKLGLKLGVAYYYFHHVQGRISSPCDTNLSNITCDTDDTRPSFAQKGNTYMPLRTPSAAALAAEATGASRYEFFGLASLFREVVATARLEVLAAPPLKLTFEGEAVRNVGFSARRTDPLAVNNRDRCDDAGNCARYVGGRDGLLWRAVVGSPDSEHQGAWNVGLTWRYLESDAVLDAFTDSDFGLGGTNLKGYVVSAGVAVADGVWTVARWMSADEIAGPRYRVDVLHVDFQARF